MPVPPLDTLGLAAEWLASGEEVAIATVMRTWGSSPCPAGSRLLVTRSGRMAGSVSGGCIESEVATRAVEALDTGAMQVVRFDVAEQRAWSVGLACGGEVEVMIEPLAAVSPGS
jgi:xanthine dehydrogenase accessory factor